MRVAVVGAGSIGREFATRHFGPRTGTVVSCVVDIREDLAKSLAADVGSVQAGSGVVGNNPYRSRPSKSIGTPVPHFRELSSDALGLCDCVYVGTTPSSHAALVKRALDAGKHVVLEKPIAADAADADIIVEAAEIARENQGLHTSMNIGMRWNRALIKMKEDLTAHGIGKLQGGVLRLHFRAWPREWQQQPWCAGRADGGPLREVGTHFLFALLELFGHENIKRVRADVLYPDGPDGSKAEESVDGAFELAAGVFGSSTPVQIELSVRTTAQLALEAAGKDLYELEVFGDSGSLKLFDFTSLSDGSAKILVDNAAYGRRECVDEVVSACANKDSKNNRTSMVTARDGRNAQRLLDGLLASKGTWIPVSFD
eukprot:TRINITY_DN41091_c0_g1_i1.p1 TRINITY_DN41091_c0_g1~~TRINITY_DN41091_c0_g1_i1.p1  ORF type:complete len:411 (-),score=49.12 TRINITY_DN41091_c0_g1_i1:121-1233(-)